MPTIQRYYLGARRRLLRIRPRDENPYATHLPVLAALSRVRPARRVLELGSGPFSTPLFLDTEVYPDLERLVSYEDDPEWAGVVRETVGVDPRFDFRIVPAVPQSVPDNVVEYDLIFIDDSQSVEARVRTIRRVAARRPSGIVAIHDYEDQHYRLAARAFDNRLTVGTFTPQVGVCWNNEGNIERPMVREAKSLVEAGSRLDVTATDSWISHLSP